MEQDKTRKSFSSENPRSQMQLQLLLKNTTIMSKTLKKVKRKSLGLLLLLLRVRIWGLLRTTLIMKILRYSPSPI
jgi:hypothetical protein